jgi:DUF971 family protein
VQRLHGSKERRVHTTVGVRDILVLEHEIAVVWGDGHESYYPASGLRKACPCAACRGETHLFGRATLPVLSRLQPAAFVPASARLVGNYGLAVTWSDGHDHGIYDLTALRAACPCEQCAAVRNLPGGDTRNA